MNELKGEKNSKVFTVTISVPSVKVKKGKFTMICQNVFYFGVDLYTLNSILFN